MTPPGWVCPKRVGFLFPHPCERTTPVDCPDCANGQVTDPYRSRHDRYGYDDYDNLEIAGLGGAMAFTEADGGKLYKPRNRFEDDLSAS